MVNRQEGESLVQSIAQCRLSIGFMGTYSAYGQAWACCLFSAIFP